MSAQQSDTAVIKPQSKITIELYVGLFALAGIAAFAYLAINLAGMRFLNTGFYSVHAEFDNVSGLEKGAAVELAGVPIGEVANIALSATSARVTMRIRDNIRLRDDDVASVRTKGIIGERYVRISAGGSDLEIADGGELSDTESVVEIEEIIGKFIHSLE